MRPFTKYLAWATLVLSFAAAQEANVTLVPAAAGIDADNTVFIYGRPPLVIANDGSAADGGFHTFQVAKSAPFQEETHQKTGRSKVVATVYDVAGRDLIINLPSTDSLIRVFNARTGEEVNSNDKMQLGDWSTACVWRSQTSGESYVFLFGKNMIVQLIVRGQNRDIEILEIQTFAVPIEGETCSVFSDGQVLFSAEDKPLYSFQAAESTSAPTVDIVSKDIKVAGLAVYHSTSGDFLLVAHDGAVDVFDRNIQKLGSMTLSGITKLEIKGGLSVLQSSTDGYPSGAFALAFEGEDYEGVAVGTFQGTLNALGIKPNTKYSPKDKPCKDCAGSIPVDCSKNGFRLGDRGCSCFPGFTNLNCSKITCENDCSGHGQCVGPNECKCKSGWAGFSCSFFAVKAKYETEANGGDGDDPAIWIHPTRPELSRIITTTKSSDGEGFGVFDLQGNLLQHLTAEEPNNVDIIYNFTIGNRNVDLAYAACRGDNTLCLVEVNNTGAIVPISGGVQELPVDFEPYGSCNYRSRKTGKEYLFVNNKEARYLQYELTANTNGTLQTTLVREFSGGSGGQVEGCVADDEAGVLFLGEEPLGIWRYEAEPTGSTVGVRIATVGDASGLHADVEGITIVPAKSGPSGYIIVSSQGISSYFVYERAAPHKFVETFTIVENTEKGIDAVSNTDGIAAVGNRLNKDFPMGLVVTHDDANQLAAGGTAKEASFKLTSLRDILGEERARALGY